MKKLIASALSLISAWAIGATLAPVQLLNPAGSTAGQAIVSTGSSTAPAWATVTAGGLTPIGANTVYGNFTGSSASPSANAVPSCSTANSALKYTSGTGLSCGTTFALTSGNLSQFASTTSAQLLGVLSDETGSGLAVFGTSPSLTTPTIAGATLSGTLAGAATFSGAITFSSTITPSQTAGIVGTTTNNNANAGSVGEYVTATSGSTGITSATPTNITSISLTAGDWDVTGNVLFSTGAGVTLVNALSAINTTSATLPSAPLYTQISGISVGASSGISAIPPTARISVSSTTTVYLVGQTQFSGGTASTQGIIRARRVR